jgi:hypothetical protein
MPNAIKYNTSAETLALKKGNFWIGAGDVGKGPTSSTGYYNGITPPSGGYTIYLNKETGGPSIYTVTTEAQMVSLTNTIGAQSFTTSGQCLNWFATQTDKMIFNIDYPAIVTNGLVVNLDAAFTPSYSQSGVTWYGVGQSDYTATLTNSPTFSTSDGGTFVFDGVDDFIAGNGVAALGYTNNYTISLWLKSVVGGYIFANKTAAGERFGIANPPFGYNVISAFFYNGSSYTTVGQSFEPNKWLNVVVTNQNQQLTIYVSLNKSTIQPTGAGPLDPGSDGLRIGRRNRTSEFYFTGNVSQLQIYDRVLSDSEITQNYEAMGSRYVSLQVQSLVVAGGGSGGKRDTGGGGAGGLLTGTTTSLTTNTNYSIIVGAGAAAPTLSGSNGVANTAAGNNGSNSTFNTTTSTGGGGGATNGINGGNGGSGGGGAAPSSIPGTGISGQGYSGGTGTLYSYAGGGGGGAGEPGGNVGPTKYASGGTGVYISEYTSLGGSPVGWFAGGGGGSLGNNDSNYNSTGGNGGGGTGGRLGNPTPINGTINTGGGGGAQGDFQISTGPAGNGGSGIVILRIPDVYTARFSSGVTSSVTKSGGYKYYKVTATSTTSETVSFS